MIKTRPAQRSAFTMIELVVVMAILALLSGLVFVSLDGFMDRYQLSRAVETVEAFDARVRRQARHSRTALRANIDRRLNRLSIDSPSLSEPASFRLPKQVEISEIWIGGSRAIGSQLTWNVNRDGQSLSYAMELRRGSARRWLVVLGGSGQPITVREKGEVDAILSL